MHHMLLYRCDGPVFDEGVLEDQEFLCGHPNMPDHFGRCGGFYTGWGVGGEVSLCFNWVIDIMEIPYQLIYFF